MLEQNNLLNEAARAYLACASYADHCVGVILDGLHNSRHADNTIIMYSTDNGAETVSWPDGGTTPFHGEKGTTWMLFMLHLTEIGKGTTWRPFMLYLTEGGKGTT